MRIVVLTDDRVGPVMAGSALRAWELGRVLQDAGHRVTVCGAPGSTAPGGDGPPVQVKPGRADLVLSPPWNLPPALFLRRSLLVVDGVTPLPAELDAMPASEAVRRRRRTAAARLPLALARADAVLAAGAAQEAWWRQALERAGRPGVPVLRVPFGIPDHDLPPGREEVEGVPPDWAVVLWWGGVWPWLDLETLLAARARLGKVPVSVVVPTGDRPGGGAPGLGREALELMAARHGLEPPQVVALRRWLPYGERHRLLNRASLLAVLHHPGEEARLAFRTRALDGVWAGVPVLVSEGGAVAELARERGWGAVVPVHRPKAVAAAMELMLTEREQLRCREALAADRAEWRWSRVAEPLVEALPGLPVAGRRGLAFAGVRAAAVLAGLGRGAR